ncbi:MAG: hypothetical protein HC838_17200 [Spirulinaceae cyanobacterium RM2_2_10]|nr:hypothetical protein [Spirulinaceae cyanobacterium RM2_2_10]
MDQYDIREITCPTPLRNLQHFEVNIRMCGAWCNRAEIDYAGQIGQCFDEAGIFIGNVMAGFHGAMSVGWSPWCCCRNRVFWGKIRFADEEYTVSEKIDVDEWIREYKRRRELE